MIETKKGRSGEYELRILELLETIQIDVSVELGRTSLAMEEILDLQIGDTVVLNKKSTMPVNLYVGNRHKFYGNLGIMGIKKALKITSQPLEDQV